MRRTEAPQAEAFGEARRRAHEQALREEAEYQAWRAAELAAAEDQPDDEEQVCGLSSVCACACICKYPHVVHRPPGTPDVAARAVAPG